MIGFLFVAAVVLVVALLAFRMIPAYIEWYTVQRALEKRWRDTNDPTLTNIRRAMDAQARRGLRRCSDGEGRRGHQERQHRHGFGELGEELPLVHNVSLLLEFDARASRHDPAS